MTFRLKGPVLGRVTKIADPEGRFVGLPLLTEYIDGYRAKVIGSIAYRIQLGRLAGNLILVLDGFLFDWASVPRVFWSILLPSGLEGQPYGIAALFHDRLCRFHDVKVGLPLTRREADDVFYEIMLYVGVKPWRAWIMWRCVVAYGIATGGW